VAFDITSFRNGGYHFCCSILADYCIDVAYLLLLCPVNFSILLKKEITQNEGQLKTAAVF
jgi:hypothetical protein